MTSEALTSSRDLKPASLGFRLIRNKYVWLAMTPFVVLLVIVAYRGYLEWRADQAVQQQFAQWVKEQVPYDNASMQAAYLKRTFPEGHSDWARAIRLSDWGSGTESYERIPYLGYEAKPPEVLAPSDKNNQWADDALVASYLDEMQPVIGLVEQASTHPTPVRFPMHFRGFHTLLPHIQHARQIARILSLDCEYAYSHGETQRALRDLSLMQSTVEAFDSRDCIVVLLVTKAVRGIRFRSVRRTLAHCVWDESELATIGEFMSAGEDLAEPFREAILNERAFALASLKELASLEELQGLLGESNSITERPVMYSDLQQVIEYYNNLSPSAGDSLLQLQKRAEELERRLNNKHSNSIAGMVLPATEQVIGSEISGEEDRRWTLTAVALRQYHQQHGSWPKQLSDLETLGLVFDDYSNMHGEIFGYEVDGESVFLWKSEHHNGKAGGISSTRPTAKEEGQSLEEKLQERERLDAYLLELHAT